VIVRSCSKLSHGKLLEHIILAEGDFTFTPPVKFCSHFQLQTDVLVLFFEKVGIAIVLAGNQQGAISSEDGTETQLLEITHTAVATIAVVADGFYSP
jgi:hypothetical protein